jgi:ABC-type multidrug transport system fused ATPase/permease subunit
VGFLLAALVHALAHGVLAVCAGLIGQALVGRQVAEVEIFAGASWARTPWLLCFLGFCAASVKTLAGSLAMYGQKRAAFQVGQSVRAEIADGILLRGAAAPQVASHAAIVVRIREVERGVEEGLLATVRAVAQLVPLAVALVLLSSTLAVGAIAILVPFATALAQLRRYFRRDRAKATHLAEELHAGVDELVRHVDLWRTYGATMRVKEELARLAEKAARSSARADAARSALSGANEALAAGALLVVVALVEAGALPLDGGSLVAFAAVFFLAYRPLRDLGDARGFVDRGAEALETLDDVIARSSRDEDPSPRDLSSTPSTVDWGLLPLFVERVGVVHEKLVTPCTSFVAQPGEIVAIIGPTGTGKTSLLRALLGLERGVTGAVRYGDVDLTHAQVGPGHRPFAWVPQEAAIITGSVEDNVALGLGDGSRSKGSEGSGDPRAALDSVGAGHLAGRTTRLSAGGPELSGGERQWVSLARALTSGLPILLFDEPTSSLDAAAQELALAAMASLRGRKTIVLVTHRPEPLAIADRVITLGNAAGDAVEIVDARPEARSKLREETGVVLEEQTDVGDAVAEHRHSLDAHAKGEARVALRVDAAVPEDLGVNHPAAEDLDPAGVLADPATRARTCVADTEDAAHVDLRAGLDEGEIARAETHGRAGAIEPLGEGGEHALELGEAHALVDQKALDLVEHR